MDGPDLAGSVKSGAAASPALAGAVANRVATTKEQAKALINLDVCFMGSIPIAGGVCNLCLEEDRETERPFKIIDNFFWTEQIKVV